MVLESAGLSRCTTSNAQRRTSNIEWQSKPQVSPPARLCVSPHVPLNSPHMRFELIDRVLERGPGRLVAMKNVTSAEEYLGDHFPGFPVLPGVMMLEALVQAGRLLAENED